MAGIDQTLAERGAVYGDYAAKADFIQRIKAMMRAAPSWMKCTPAMRESLEMDIHKTARILWGDPAYRDNWVDKMGYIQLVVNDLYKAPGASAPADYLPTEREPGDPIPLMQERGIQFRGTRSGSAFEDEDNGC